MSLTKDSSGTVSVIQARKTDDEAFHAARRTSAATRWKSALCSRDGVQSPRKMAFLCMATPVTPLFYKSMLL